MFKKIILKWTEKTTIPFTKEKSFSYHTNVLLSTKKKRKKKSLQTNLTFKKQILQTKKKQ